MFANVFMPPTLPLMSDGDLNRLRFTYQARHRALTDASLANERLDLEEALEAIASELHARGIEADPWWVTRRSPVRGPNRRVAVGPNRVNVRAKSSP